MSGEGRFEPAEAAAFWSTERPLRTKAVDRTRSDRTLSVGSDTDYHTYRTGTTKNGVPDRNALLVAIQA